MEFLLSLSLLIRECEALSEHIITCAKSYFYNDNEPEIKTKGMVKNPVLGMTSHRVSHTCGGFELKSKDY
jgi:hypothetical protein